MIYLGSLFIPLLALLPNLFFAAAGGAREPSGRDQGVTTGGRADSRGAVGGSPSGKAASLLGAGGASGAEPLPFVLLERVGQVGVFLAPILSPMYFGSLYDMIAVVGMALSLGLYYACWTRYFVHGRARRLLVKSLLGIPIPMAVAPVFYFLFAAEIQRSVVVLIAAVLFAGGHIPITLMQRKRLRSSP